MQLSQLFGFQNPVLGNSPWTTSPRTFKPLSRPVILPKWRCHSGVIHALIYPLRVNNHKQGFHGLPPCLQVYEWCAGGLFQQGKTSQSSMQILQLISAHASVIKLRVAHGQGDRVRDKDLEEQGIVGWNSARSTIRCIRGLERVILALFSALGC